MQLSEFIMESFDYLLELELNEAKLTESIKFEVKNSSEVKPDEWIDIIELIRSGGQIKTQFLNGIPSRCVDVCIGRDSNVEENNIVGFLAFKKPLRTYVETVMDSIGEDPEKYKYELGYLVVREDFRNIIIAARLFFELLDGSAISRERSFFTCREDNERINKIASFLVKKKDNFNLKGSYMSSGNKINIYTVN